MASLAELIIWIKHVCKQQKKFEWICIVNLCEYYNCVNLHETPVSMKFWSSPLEFTLMRVHCIEHAPSETAYLRLVNDPRWRHESETSITGQNNCSVFAVVHNVIVNTPKQSCMEYIGMGRVGFTNRISFTHQILMIPNMCLMIHTHTLMHERVTTSTCIITAPGRSPRAICSCGYSWVIKSL